MPEFLKKSLEKEYPNNPHAVWGTLNKIGAVRGNRETARGRAMEAKHARDTKAKAKPKRSQSAVRTDAGQYDGKPAPPGMGAFTTKPRVRKNPPDLAGRRTAARSNAYPDQTLDDE